MGHQLANMAMLYVLIGLLNKRARKAGDNAARQVGSSTSGSAVVVQHTGGGRSSRSVHRYKQWRVPISQRQQQRPQQQMQANKSNSSSRQEQHNPLAATEWEGPEWLQQRQQ